MADVSNVALQKVHINSHNSGDELYWGKTNRDIIAYPKTSNGRAAMAAAIKAGTYPNPITCSNGAIIAANTVPPLTLPDAPVSSYPAYSQTQTYTGEEFVHGDSGSGATTRDFNFTGMPKEDDDYNYLFTYQSNVGTPGQGGIRVAGVNGGARQTTFNTEQAEGGTRTVTGTLSLKAGANTVTVENVSGIPIQPKSMTITRAAGA